MNGNAYTISDILKLPFLRDARVLAGQEGIHAAVCSVTVLDAPDGVEWIKGGEFVVSTLYPFQEELLPFIRGLRERGAAGLGIKLNRYLDTIPPEVLATADALRLPLIQIPYECSFVDIINPVLSEIMNQQLAVLRSGEQRFHAMREQVLQGGDLDSIVRVLSTLIDNPVFIHELINHRSVGFPFSLADRDAVGDLVRVNESCESEELLPRYQELQIRRVIGPRGSRLLVPIVVNRQTEGYIIVLEQRRKCTTLDHMTVNHAATIAGLYLVGVRAVREVNQRFRDDFLERMVRGEIGGDSALEKRAGELGWHPEPHNTICLLGMEEDSYEGAYRLFRLVKQHLARHRYNTAALMSGIDSGERVLLVCPVPPGRPYKESMEKRLDALLQQLSGPETPFNIGVGRPFHGLTNAPESYREACAALRIGRSLQGPGSRIFFEDLGAYRILHGSLDAPDAESFVEEYILPVARWDRQHNTDLLQTLKTYLETGCNYRLSARRLFVHHNSIKYRMEKIGKLTGLDPSLPDHLLEYHIALRLYDMRETVAKERGRGDTL